MEVKRELIRGAGPVAVLQMLKRRDMYGYELAEALSQRSDGVLALGQSTLYPLLYNLESKRYVESRWVELPSGRKRRYYRLTERGAQVLEERRAEWQELFEAMVGLGLVTPIGQEG
ncbi:MAG: PadR family transcriptional regulator [Gemmatimonadetes bacterium]|nr:PadR family transcriptional regulator [Gemmatimonadota bacterium]MCC7131347.1 PadR family transcriptional regulator [Gemmatimonadales bacterium]